AAGGDQIKDFRQKQTVDNMTADFDLFHVRQRLVGDVWRMKHHCVGSLFQTRSWSGFPRPCSHSIRAFYGLNSDRPLSYTYLRLNAALVLAVVACAFALPV